MVAAYPGAPEEADTDIREDGIAGHWLASELWNGIEIALESMAPNGRIITEELADAVDEYIDFLRSCSEGEWYVEQKQDCSPFYPGMTGTPDAFQVAPGVRSKFLLRVADLKLGYRFVEVFGNLQLSIYAFVIARHLNLPPETEIELVIVQPRSFHRDGSVRRWNTTYAELERDIISPLRERAALAMSDGAMCIPNPGCFDCAARHACMAYQHSTLLATERAYEGLPHELTPEAASVELARLMDAAKKIEGRISGLEAVVTSHIKKGFQSHLFDFETTFGRRRYQDGKELEVIALGKLFGTDLAAPLKPISPAQAEERNPQLKEILKQYTVRPSNGMKLVKADPNRARKAHQQRR